MGKAVRNRAKRKTNVDSYWKADVLDGREPPKTVYHYTSSYGLEGILQRRAIYATDLAFLNDPTEFAYGAKAALMVMGEVLRRCPKDFLSAKQSLLYNEMSLEELYERLEFALPSIRGRFVYGAACFCEDGDLLSQWQGYASPGGYAIGFDFAELRSRLSREAIRLAPVVYSHEGHNAILAEHLADWVKRLDPRADPWPSQDKAMDFLHRFLLGFSAQIKHQKFAHELEWRVADLELTTSPAIKFRQGSLGITPYLEIDLCKTGAGEKLPIERVVVGPGADYEIRRRSVEVILENLGYEGVQVTQSSIPFRVQ